MKALEPPTIDWRYALLLLGVLYAFAGASYAFVPIFEDQTLSTDLVLAGLIGGPGALLLHRGYRLPQSSIRPEFYRTIAVYCLVAIGSLLVILGLIEATAGLRDPLENVLILTALASTAGLAAGQHDARAKSRQRDLELRNQELKQAKSEIEETVDQLQTANDRLEQFTHAASHDLQEPLRMVSSYLQLLENRHGDDLDEEAAEYLEFAVGNADRMRAMVEGLLEYSRVASYDDALTPTDATAVLNATVDGLQQQIEETGATIEVDELPEINADSNQLGIVFDNLLSNALIFHGETPPQIQVGAERRGERWQFSVRDDGIGIDPEYHEQIFTAFEGLNGVDENEKVPDGGIGLALCERIVERHGGEIWVESEPGEGSTFYFTMPPA